MSNARWLSTAAIVGLSSLFGAGAASADPATSKESAWAPLTKAVAQPPKDARERRGQEVFEQRCAACHAAVPKDMIGPPYMPPMPGTQALQARYKGEKPAELERRTDLTPAFVAAIVRGGLNSMPFFRPTELSVDDLRALGAYFARKH
jgi:mono/diheme cytochrome c family protein